MEGESCTRPQPRHVIVFIVIACLACADYAKLWRCFVGIEFRIRTNQFMWKRNILFFSIWISVIPALLGRLIDLMILIPWQVPLNETPVYSSFHEWLYGLAALLIWSYLIVFTEMDCFQTAAWQGKIERIKREGIDRLPLDWLIKSVIGSALQTLLASLIVPYVVSLFLGAFVGAAAQRLVWPALLVLIIACFVYRLVMRMIIHAPEVEYDRLYLFGHKLMDYDSHTDSYVLNREALRSVGFFC